MGIISNILDIVFDRPIKVGDLLAVGKKVTLYSDANGTFTIERARSGKVRICLDNRATGAATVLDLSHDAAFNAAGQIKTVVQKLAQYDRKK